ncbi:hypothetical protein ACF08M_12560 [Streptomyces sp. NPDC015032]
MFSGPAVDELLDVILGEVLDPDMPKPIADVHPGEPLCPTLRPPLER